MDTGREAVHRGQSLRASRGTELFAFSGEPHSAPLLSGRTRSYAHHFRERF